MLDEEDDDWLLQSNDIAEAEYFKSKASMAFDWGTSTTSWILRQMI
jgi:hypothetical protein